MKRIKNVQSVYGVYNLACTTSDMHCKRTQNKVFQEHWGRTEPGLTLLWWV